MYVCIYNDANGNATDTVRMYVCIYNDANGNATDTVRISSGQRKRASSKNLEHRRGAFQKMIFSLLIIF